jgi:protein-S-isoprenylcysteine O-methyltransferase Ste14
MVDRTNVEANRPAPEPGDAWAHGGAWVMAQFPLTALALFLARVGPTIPQIVSGPARLLGAGLFIAGILLFVAGALALGSRLTTPSRSGGAAPLVQTGAFALARHPVYGGSAIAVIGWALFNGAWLGINAAVGLMLFVDVRTFLEERWLSAKFPEYRYYRRRVRKLIPFVY